MLALSLVAQVGILPHAVRADGRTPLAWNPEHRRVSPYELAATATFAVAAGTLRLAFHPPPSNGRVGEYAPDETVRHGIRLDDPVSRRTASAISDVAVFSLLGYRLLVEPLYVALGPPRSPDVAKQMFAIDAQSLALTTLVTLVTKHAVRRARPFVRTCSEESPPSSECALADRHASFWSGHAATAFTAAGLVCVHHANLPIYARRHAGAATCASALGVATAVGALRMASDRHYLSDVVVGAVVGLLSGYVLPHLVHYRVRTPLRLPGAVVPAVEQGGASLRYLQAF